LLVKRNYRLNEAIADGGERRFERRPVPATSGRRAGAIRKHGRAHLPSSHLNG
jgi:hypothetical protein